MKQNVDKHWRKKKNNSVFITEYLYAAAARNQQTLHLPSNNLCVSVTQIQRMSAFVALAAE